MKTTWVYERTDKDYWLKHFVGCSIVFGSILCGIYLSAKRDMEQVSQPREINQYEYRDFINFSEWQAVKDMCAATCPGDRDKQIEHFEKWALTKDKQEIKSMLELMDNIPACLPEKNGLLNVLSYDEEK